MAAILPILFLLLQLFRNGSAINKCSHSMNYTNLCPNPMLVSSGHDFDMMINLTRHHNDTCKFFKDDNEVTVVGGINVMENSYLFSKAATCNHFVKLLLDRNSHIGKSRICGKELGMKVRDTYIWHNFSLTQNNFVYDDLIPNYGHSSFEVQCTHRPRFVLFLFETFRDSKCVLLVQQYQVIDHQYGCDYQRNPVQHRFCGAYPCSGINSILQELKLIARPPIQQNSGNSHREQVYEPHLEVSNPGPNLKNKGEKSIIKYIEAVIPTTTKTPTTTSGVLGDQKPIDWAEWCVRLFFPVIGLAFILLLLRILKGRYVNELCGRQGHYPNPYLGSTASMDKQGLN